MTEYGPAAEFWGSFLEMAEILVAFHRSVRTGQWQAHLAASKKEKQKILERFFAYDHRNYARLAKCHFISVKRHSSPELV